MESFLLIVPEIDFSGKFRRALQLDQSVSKDNSEVTISPDEREI